MYEKVGLGTPGWFGQFVAVLATKPAAAVTVAAAIWRSCYDGRITWLNTVERGSQYEVGDAWGFQQP
jgi:hypothetical protein